MSNAENWIVFGPASGSSFGFNSEPSLYSKIADKIDENTYFQRNPDGTILAIPRQRTLRNLSLTELARRLEKCLGDQETLNGTNTK